MPGDLHYIGNRPALYPQNIPAELKQRPKWVLWQYVMRDGKRTKPPFRIDGQMAKPTDPADWGKFEDVLAEWQSNPNYHGIGFVLTEDDDIVAWDLDHVLDPKTQEFTSALAKELVDGLKSYTEVSPSGEGVRILVRGKLPKDGRKKGPIECYQSKRYITITGDHWPGSPSTIEERPDFFWRKVFEAEDPGVKSLLRDAIAKRLWEGDWQDIPDGKDASKKRYASQSDADAALVRHLAYATDGDAQRMDALFRQSKLMREKWDQPARDGETYGAGTIRFVLEKFSRQFHETDLGNAKRFASLYRDDVRFATGSWFVWDGKVLREDRLQRTVLMVDKVIEQIREEARGMDDEERKKKLLGHSYKLESRGQIESMLKLAQAREPLAVLPEELDNRDDLFCCANGTVDEAGKLREHRFSDLLTKSSPYEYDEKAEAPEWERFLEQVIPDEELRKYLQRAIGYSLTGRMTEQKLFIAFGTGSNGKSTFFDAVMRVLGDYSRTVPTDLLMATRSDQHPTSLADLRGVRLALAAETQEGRRLNEQLVKQITGGDRLVARRMHQDFFEFRSTAKLWIMANHEPQIRGTDLAIWRRIHKIPFTVTIPESKQNKLLPRILEAESAGILTWCIRGLRSWREKGLAAPATVIAATEEYRREQDMIGGFIEEFCIEDKREALPHNELYEAYARYSENSREFVLSSRKFASKLRERGLKDFRSTGNKMFWKGIKFRAGQEPERGQFE